MRHYLFSRARVGNLMLSKQNQAGWRIQLIRAFGFPLKTGAVLSLGLDTTLAAAEQILFSHF